MMQVAPDFHQHVLRDVFGVFAVVEIPLSLCADAGAVAHPTFGQCAGVTALQSLQEVRFGVDTNRARQHGPYPTRAMAVDL